MAKSLMITQSTQKILIVAPSWVGDLVMANALLQILKKQNSATQIHVLANQYLQPVLQHMAEVDQIIISPFGHGALQLKQRYLLAKKLRQEKYTQAIILPNSFKSALIPFWAKIPLRTGWRGEMRYCLLNDLRILNPKLLPLMVQRFVALGFPKDAKFPENYPWPELQVNPESIQATLKNLQVKLFDKPVLILCPGAEYGPAKQWPAEHFAVVAKTMAQAGWNVWILGSAKDSNVAAAIHKQSGNVCVDFTGKTDLGSAIDLLSLSNAVVTNDSGLMHVAAALHKKIIAIYGSSSPNFTPPLAKHVTILSKNLPCSPCFKRVCSYGHYNCLKEIQPEQVLTELSHETPCN